MHALKNPNARPKQKRSGGDYSPLVGKKTSIGGRGCPATKLARKATKPCISQVNTEIFGVRGIY